MSHPLRFLLVLPVLLAASACTTMPSGPSMLTLPGTGKNFDQFRADDLDCRQYANLQVGGTTPNQAAADSGVKSALVGTAIGAAAGAAFNGSKGAGVGAGAGLLVGALAGTAAGQNSSYALQQRYDFAYTQCMYAKGDKVPMSGYFANQRPPRAPAYSYYPPPPPPPPSP